MLFIFIVLYIVQCHTLRYDSVGLYYLYKRCNIAGMRGSVSIPPVKTLTDPAHSSSKEYC